MNENVTCKVNNIEYVLVQGVKESCEGCVAEGLHDRFCSDLGDQCVNTAGIWKLKEENNENIHN